MAETSLFGPGAETMFSYEVASRADQKLTVKFGASGLVVAGQDHVGDLERDRVHPLKRERAGTRKCLE